MKIVIDIPKEAFKYIKDNKELGWLSDHELAQVIAKGVPPEQITEWVYNNAIKSCNKCGIGLASAYDNYCPNCGARMKGDI